jgi:hypothetical protein
MCFWSVCLHCVLETNFLRPFQIIPQVIFTRCVINNIFYLCQFGSEIMLQPLSIWTSGDNAVGIVPGYVLYDRGVWVQILVYSRIFSTSSRMALESTQPPIQWEPEALSPGLKRSGLEAGHSPRTSAEIKKTWVYPPTPPYVFML